MILKNKYPICEFDTGKNPIIQAANFLTEGLPEKCVITFFRKELERFAAEKNLPTIGYLNSEVSLSQSLRSEMREHPITT